MRHSARLACIASAVVLLAACSAAPPSASPTTSGAPSRSVPASASTTAPAPAPSTGAALKAVLVTTVPEGFELDADGTVDTGLDLQDEVNGAMESPAHCADLDATSWIQTSGMSGVSFAQSDYVDGDDQEIAQEVDSFDSAEHASRALAQLTAFMKTCTTFRDADSTRYDLSVSAAPGLGQGAVEGVISSPRIEGGVVEVAAVSGTEVITVLYSARKLSTARHAVGIASGIRGNLGA